MGWSLFHLILLPSLLPIRPRTVEKLMVVYDTGISTSFSTTTINPIIRL